MSRKKVIEIGNFTIISKTPKGRKSNVVYTFEYQRTGKPEIFKVQMLWLDFRKGNETWAFMDGRESEKLSIEERKEFIAEIPKFQKGGSYRKTHPITYSKSGLLKQSIKHKEYELQVLKDELESAENKELVCKCNKYRNMIDTKKLDFISKQLSKIEEKTNCIIRLKYVGYCSKIIIYDRDTSIPIGEIRNVLNNNIESWRVGQLDDYDIKSIIKNNENLSNSLEE